MFLKSSIFSENIETFKKRLIMNKRDLIRSVSAKSGLSQNTSAVMVNALLETLCENFEAGHSTIIHGFGSFMIRQRAERRGVNPTTGNSITIAAHKTVKFTPSKTLIIK